MLKNFDDEDAFDDALEITRDAVSGQVATEIDRLQAKVHDLRIRAEDAEMLAKRREWGAEEMDRLRARVRVLEQPRREVRFMAAEMERKLRSHDDRPGWENCEIQWLLKRLREETNELEDAAVNHMAVCRANFRSVSEGPMFPPDVAGEAADVANFAMFIADVCGELEGEDE